MRRLKPVNIGSQKHANETLKNAEKIPDLTLMAFNGEVNQVYFKANVIIAI